MMNLWKHLIFVLLCVFSAVSQAAWSVRYQHTDVLGSVIAESNSQGTITQRFGYKPFGEGSPTQKTGVGYTGHLEDTDLGLTYMQQRYYDPVIGRFYSNDPVGFRDTHSFNRYVYANNNPYKYVDTNGKWATWVHRRMTYNAAKKAGWSESRAKALGQAVVDVDKGTQGSECSDTVVHGMNCSGTQTSEEAIQNAQGRVNDPLLALAQRIHTQQDLTADHHAGVTWQDPFASKDVVSFVMNSVSAIVHLIKDIFISEEKEDETTEETQDLIENCENNCE